MGNLRETKFSNWKNAYNDYKTALNNLNLSLGRDSNEKITKLINEAYLSAIKTLTLYLRNNGLFKNTTLDVIKECFYIDFIENGEAWIEVYEYFENSDKDLIDTDFIKKSAEIFNTLDNSFIGVLENDY